MAQYGDQYGDAARQTDEYGNPVGERHGGAGAYGIGIGHTATTGAYGTGMGHTGGTGTGLTGSTGAYGAGGAEGYGGGEHLHQQQQHGLHRTGSSSSSSSEDDGQGGRRKKGIKEKIKEKLPGGHKDQAHDAATTTPASGGYVGEQEEKKGMMDKIKEKLPGHRA